MARVTTDASGQAAPRATGNAPAVPGTPGLALVAAVLTLVLAVLMLNIPYFALAPGPAPDVFKIIKVGGVKTKPVHGHLLLTTVSVSQKEIRIGDAIRSWFDTNYELLPRSVFIPPGGTEEDEQRENARQMDESQRNAATAALSYLGYDVKLTLGARINEVAKGLPASAVLKAGDVVIGADHKPVHHTTDLATVIRAHKVGEAVTLTVLRDGRAITVTSKTVQRKEKPHDAIIGVVLADFQSSKLPLAVDIASLGIGGPSAGLMFALGIVDLLDSSDLAHSRTVAGTGAIDPTGIVQEVGGIRQKVAAARESGATLFIAPLSEIDEACARAGAMQVIGVKTLDDAVRALRGSAVPADRTCR